MVVVVVTAHSNLPLGRLEMLEAQAAQAKARPHLQTVASRPGHRPLHHPHHLRHLHRRVQQGELQLLEGPTLLVTLRKLVRRPQRLLQ